MGRQADEIGRSNNRHWSRYETKRDRSSESILYDGARKNTKQELSLVYLGATTMKALDEVFKEQCRRAFRFLEDEYDCEIAESYQDSHAVSITYTNMTTGVEISLEPRENHIWVYLIRLVNGKIPAYLDA